MAAEIWVTVILKVIILILVGHVAITRIVPLLNDFLLGFIKDKRPVDSFTSLVDIFILVLVCKKIVEIVLEAGNTALSYISIFDPGLTVLNSLFMYIQWIVLVLMALVALKNIK